MKYRIFTNDRGPHAYSGFAPLEARTEAHAYDLAQSKVQGLRNFGGRALRVLVIPEKQASTIDDETLSQMSRERFGV